MDGESSGLQLLSRFVARCHESGEREGSLQAATLFVDVSGFTATTESLMAHGKGGAVVLTRAIESVFAPIVAAVHAFDGEVVTFAGDACLALFPGGADAVRRAVAAARELLAALEDRAEQETPFGPVRFATRAGVGSGVVQWGRSGPDDGTQVAWFLGAAQLRATDAQAQAPVGTFAIHREALALVREALVVTPLDDDVSRVDDLREPTPARTPAVWEPAPETLAAYVPAVIRERGHHREFRRAFAVFLSVRDVGSKRDVDAVLGPFLHEVDRLGGVLIHAEAADKGFVVAALWGAPVSREQDAQRALEAVLSLRAALGPERWARVRVGAAHRRMFTGVVGGAGRGVYTCYGLGMNLAARLATSAPWGHIWVDPELAREASDRFLLTAKGAHTFKGLSASVAVHALIDRSPWTTESRFRGGLVGRDEELGLLAEAVAPGLGLVEDERDGIAAALVVGEPGIGKSRLVAALSERLQRHHGVSWVQLPCDELDRTPHRPIRRGLAALTGQSRHATPEVNLAALEQHVGEVLRELDYLLARDPADDGPVAMARRAARLALPMVVPSLAEMLDLPTTDGLWDDRDAALLHEHRIEALVVLFRVMLAIRPVVLAIEDVQWLDLDASRLLAQVLERLDGQLAVVITSRPLPFAAPEHPSTWASDVLATTVVSLDTLDDAAIGALVTDRIGGLASARLRRLLMARSQGNPLFAEQVLLHLSDAGLLVRNGGGVDVVSDRVAETVPSTLEDLLVARLDRLPVAVGEVVRAASVLGAEFELSVLEHVVDEPEVVADGVVAATEASVWSMVRQQWVAFRHALLRDAAYQLQLPGRLAVLHARAAGAIEKLHVDAMRRWYAVIAHHREAAGQLASAAAAYARAAEVAREQYAFDAAVGLYRQALSLEADQVRRWALEDALVEVLYVHNDWDTLIVEAERSMRVRAGRDRLAWGRLAVWRGRVHARVAELDELDALLTPLEELLAGRTGREARWLLGMSALVRAEGARTRGGHGEGLEEARRASEVFRELGETDLEVQARCVVGSLHWRYDELDASYDTFVGIALRAAEAEMPRAEGHAKLEMAEVERVRRHFDEALALHTEALEIHRRCRSRSGIASSLNNLGLTYSDMGRYDEALAHFEDALAHRSSFVDPDAVSATLQNVGQVLWRQRRTREARVWFERSLAMAVAHQFEDGIASATNNLGAVCATLGDWLSAREHFRAALRIRRSVGCRVGVASALYNLGYTALHLGELDRARRHFTEATGVWDDLGMRGWAPRGLSMLGWIAALDERCDDARLHLDGAFARISEEGDLEQGLAWLAVGRMLAADPDVDVSALGPHAGAIAWVEEGIRRAREARYAETLVPGLYLLAELTGDAGHADEADRLAVDSGNPGLRRGRSAEAARG